MKNEPDPKMKATTVTTQASVPIEKEEHILSGQKQHRIQRKPVPHNVSTYIAPSSTRPSHTGTSPLFTRVRSWWSFLSYRNRIIILIAVSAIIITIVGLSAGLSVRAHRGISNLPLPTNTGGPFSGDLTYYGPGLGACGITSTNSDRIVAVSHYLFDAVSVGSNPNANPLCGKKIRARREDRSVDLTVVDRCVGCQPNDLDVTIDTFGLLADVDLGRVNVEWAWLE